MKKILLFALVAALAFSGCKKDEDSKPSYNGEVTIGTVKTSFTNMQFVKSETSTSYSISNYGTEAGTNDLDIVLSNPVVGDNNFDSGDNYIYITIGTKDYYSKTSTGKIVVTKKTDSEVSGTFSGTFYDNDTNTEIQISGSFTSKKFEWNFGGLL